MGLHSPPLISLRDTYIKQEPGETPNDRNDRAIRRAAEWYVQRLPTKPILLLTDDAANRAKALAAGVEAMTCMQYARTRQEEVPELVDLVSAGIATAEDEDHGTCKKGKKEGLLCCVETLCVRMKEPMPWPCA